MKIGIITLPLNINYGGILQAYALQTVLERMGHEVCLIEYKNKPRSCWKKARYYGKCVLKAVLKELSPSMYDRKVNHGANIVRQHINKFIGKYIKSRIIDDFSKIAESDYDAFVVGSDQIWRPKYFSQIEHAYLDFAQHWDVKRIAYAASFGTDEWEYDAKQTRRCGTLLKSFDAVSVRENSGVSLCRKYFHVDAVHLLDPTMLLTAEDYIRLVKDAAIPQSKGTMLCYILDKTDEKATLIDNIAKEKHLVPFSVNSKTDNVHAPIVDRIKPSVEQWLRGFYDAEFVVTDSFHGCVFSILFNKPFIAIGNTERGMARFKSLLVQFELEERLVTIGDDIFSIVRTCIEYDKANTKLAEMRKKSMKFLENAIK